MREIVNLVEIRIRDLAWKRVGPLSNSEHLNIIDLKRRGPGVSFGSERGTTQTAVRVPKYQLSVKGRRASTVRDREEVGLEAATL